MEKETPKPSLENTKLEVNRVHKLLFLCNGEHKPKDREDLQQLVAQSKVARKYLETQPDIYAVALRTRIESLKASDAFKEIMRVKCDKLRNDLGYNISNPLEKLAIEQIVLCWINHLQTEIQHSNMTTGEHSLTEGLYWEKRLAYSNRRYERAMELLSRMRKMNLVIQVNNATNQIVNNGNS